MLQRMNELAVKAANGTMSSSDKADVQNEIAQLSTEIDRVATTTKFNETYLLSGSAGGKSETAKWNGSLSFALQVGADNKANNRITVNIYSISASALGVGVNENITNTSLVNDYHYGVNDNGSIVKINGTGSTSDGVNATQGDKWATDGYIKAGSVLPVGSVSNNGNVWTGAVTKYTTGSVSSGTAPQGGGYISTKTTSTARAAIDNISAAIKLVSARRSALGAVQNRLEHTIKNLDNVVENTTAAESQIRDTDMAAEMVQYSKNNILQQAGQSMLAQANQSNQGVLSLLG
jgi:flagellin